MSEIPEFDAKLRRLKRVLGLAQDKEVADLLGISKAALSDRKRRNSFPDDRVMALIARYPTLDVAYVLTGISGTDRRSELEDAWLEGGLEALLNRLSSDDHARRTRAERVQQLHQLAGSCDDQDLELLLRLAARLSSSTGKSKG